MTCVTKYVQNSGGAHCVRPCRPAARFRLFEMLSFLSCVHCNCGMESWNECKHYPHYIVLLFAHIYKIHNSENKGCRNRAADLHIRPVVILKYNSKIASNSSSVRVCTYNLMGNRTWSCQSPPPFRWRSFASRLSLRSAPWTC